MTLPGFVVVGVRKCGTTWLHRCLSEHPDIFLAARTKELFYFDTYWQRGRDWYARHFRDCGSSRVCVDVAPSCFASVEAAARIRDTIPNARLVFIFRDPVERVASLYEHLRARGSMPLPLADAIERYPSLLEEGFYARHFARYRQLFGEQSLLPLLLEEVNRSETGGLVPLFRFLGVDERFTPPSLVQRVYEHRKARSPLVARAAATVSRQLRRAGLHGVIGLAKSTGADRIILRPPQRRADPVAPAIVAQLRQIYQREIEELSQMLERDLSTLWGHEGPHRAGSGNENASRQR